MNNNTSKIFVSVGAAFALVFGVFMATPAQAHAFELGQLIDPGCFFACGSGGGGGHKVVTNNYYGNYRSPGGIVTGGGSITVTSPTTVTSGTPVASNPVVTNNNYNYNTVNSAPTQSSPVYSYNVNPAPFYTYGSTYSYSQPTVVQPVFVQQASPFVQQQSVYVQQYSPIYVSCSVNTSNATIGSTVVWTAYVSGGSGYYTYSWSGSDGFYSSGQSAYFSYQAPGFKTASVTVFSDGQSITQNCSTGVSVSAPIVFAQPIPQPVPVPVYPRSSNFNGLDIGCFADPSTASPNQPVTWNVEVTGGIGPYTYSWTGTDGLTGSAASIIKYYNTSGTKNAVVTVTSADGRNAVHACSNTVTVRGSVAKPALKPQPAPVQQPPVQQNNGLSAASLFSLSAIPWGWVSVLVILVLFGAVLYLLYNKSKI